MYSWPEVEITTILNMVNYRTFHENQPNVQTLNHLLMKLQYIFAMATI